MDHGSQYLYAGRSGPKARARWQSRLHLVRVGRQWRQAKLKTVKTDAINKLIREAAVDPLQKQLLASRWGYTRFFADCLCDLSFEESPPAMGD